MSILVGISDDIDARVAAHLLKQVDRDVVPVGTLADVRRRLAEQSWTAVVVDAVLPDGTVFDLLPALPTRRGQSEAAIVVLGLEQGLALKVRALEAGADDYLAYPYEPAELLARVRAVTRRSRRRLGTAESAIVRVGPVALDARALEVMLPGNRRARLTPSEMRVLHYLMAQAPRVVGCAELATQLFDAVTEGTTANTVGVYVRRVRRKIERDPAQPQLIRSVRGRGYRFTYPDDDSGSR